jgi:hypothetical protein
MSEDAAPLKSGATPAGRRFCGAQGAELGIRVLEALQTGYAP